MVKNRYHDDIPQEIRDGEDIAYKWMPPESDYLDFFGFGGPLVPAMNKPLIIQVGMTGFFIRKKDNPNQPLSPEEIGDDAIKSIKAGAVMFHVHAKHPKDGSPCHDPKVYKAIMDRVWDECPDAIVSLCPLGNIGAPTFTEVARPIMEPLYKYEEESGGKRKYGGHSVMTHASSMDFPGGHTLTATPDEVQETCKWLEKRGTKPGMQCWSSYASQTVKKTLIDTKILTPPYIIDIDFGKEGSGMADTPEKDLWMYRELLNWIEIMPTENVVRGAWIGGNNWLPLATLAIATGIDMIATGMEDMTYRYPHKKEFIKESADCVKAIVQIAKAFGREIATPKQAKEIMGLDKVNLRGAFKGPI